jgi:adenosine deaminase
VPGDDRPVRRAPGADVGRGAPPPSWSAADVTPDVAPDVFGAAEPLAELHTHLGGSVPTHILWEIAHTTGVSTGVADYWEFAAKVSVPDAGVDGLDPLDDIYALCERIQSSPDAVERAVHALISGGYRKQRITTVEVRFNPAKRNRSAEIDLDHVVLAACRAVDRASIEYPAVRAGVVLMCDRTFSPALNDVIVDKALRWRDRGVVGVDLGGPRPHPGRYDYTVHADAFVAARDAGLGVTVHCGEDGDPTEIGDVVASLRPHRIGHGVLAHRDPAVLDAIIDAGVVLEWCPTSNLRTGVFGSVDELAEAYGSMLAAGVHATVSTDGPEMMRTQLRDEYALLVGAGVFDVEAAHVANQLAHDASFAPPLR